MEINTILNFLSMEIPIIGISIGNIIATIAVIIGYFISIFVSKYVKKMMIRANLSEILSEFAYRVLKVIILIFLFSTAIGFLDIDIAAALISISVVFGLVFGLAFQDTLGNLTAGFMIAVTKPFKKDDFVDIAGLSGIISNVGISITTIITLDNKRVIIPNSKVWGEPITNYTALNTRRIDMSIGIGYSDNISKAIRVIGDILKNNKNVLKDLSPTVAVDELTDSSVNA